MTPPNQTVEVKGVGRHYLCPDGILRPSVTTILSAIAKPGLIYWSANEERRFGIDASTALYLRLIDQPALDEATYRAQLTAELGTVKAHTKALTAAAEIGTQTHHYIEWVLKKDLGQLQVGGPPPLSPKALLAYQAFDHWRDGVRLIPQRIEQQVWSVTHGYAGTLDLLASITLDGERRHAMLDFKTGKALYPESFLQIAAYMQALIEMGHLREPGYSVLCRLPKVERDPAPEIRVVTPEEHAAYFAIFLHVKALWDWLQINEKARQAARSGGPPMGGAGLSTSGAESTAAPPPVPPDPQWTTRAINSPVADINIALAQLPRQPTREQWERIVLAHTGVRDMQEAELGSLISLRNTVRGLAAKDPVAIRHVRSILAAPVPAPASVPSIDIDGSGYLQARITETTAALTAAVPDLMRPDPREELLAAIEAEKAKLERSPPADVWAAICRDLCGTSELANADPVVLEELLAFVRGLVTEDRTTHLRLREILTAMPKV